MNGATTAVVEVGEGGGRRAAGAGAGAATAGLREKRVPDDKRMTTPYLTKYERARVLGVRSLQIRCVCVFVFFVFSFFWVGLFLRFFFSPINNPSVWEIFDFAADDRWMGFGVR